MFDRRQLVKLSAGAAMGRIMGIRSLSLARVVEAAADSSLERIGVQLYTVRALMAEDFEGTLEAVADIGFHQVEFDGYFGRQPQQVRDILERVGLDAPAAHFPWQAFRGDLEGVIETAGAVGHRYVVLGWLPPEERSSIAQYLELAALCNRVGEVCNRAGLRFAYHNHDFELRPVDRQVPFDLLLKETDPELVEFEIDLFWTIKAGHDPVEYFAAHPGRFTLCHVKDMAEGEKMVAVGAGEIDLAAIFGRQEQAGLQYFFVEHDEPADPLASIASSFAYLQGLKF